jgi:hypothetical protein
MLNPATGVQLPQCRYTILQRQQQPVACCLQVRIRLPKSSSQQQQGRPAALWQTTYLDGAYRVGRGSSGNVFLFRRHRSVNGDKTHM